GPSITSNDFECHIDVGSFDAPWHLLVKGRWPFVRLPNVYLTDPTQAANMAHVNYEGDVCYSDREGEGVSPEDADAPCVLPNVVKRSWETLEASAAMRDRGNCNDLPDEFEGFWNSRPSCRTVLIESDPQNGAQR